MAIQYGATGDGVKKLQTNLNSVGNYNLDVDGSFGPATLAAVQDFQSNNNLTVDGIVGPQTSAALSASQAAPATPTAPATAPGATTPMPTPAEKAPATSGTQTPGVTAAQPSISGANLVDQQNIPDANQSKANQQGMLGQWISGAVQQSNNSIDYAVNQAVTELQRAEADAQVQFKEQQESITRDEMQARDNSALYAEARGDKGGIGQEQYNSIMNAAAINRQTVRQQQTKLSTDTARQIADLRAKGEFDKADALLELTQNYLSQLLSLEQWALEFGLSAAQFQEQMNQWGREFELAVSDVTGYYQGKPTQSYLQTQHNRQATVADQALTLATTIPGYTLSELQYAAIKEVYGMDKATVDSAIEAARLAAQTGSSGDNADYVSAYQKAYDAGCRSYEDAWAFFVSKEGGGYSNEEAENLATNFEEKWKENKTQFLDVPDYKTIWENSASGLYGPRFNIVLNLVQSMWSSKKDNEAIAEVLERELDKGSINEYGAAAIMQTLRI